MKKIKAIQLLIGLLFIGTKTFAGVKIEWSADIPRENFVSQILGEDRNGVFTLSNKGSNYFLNKFESKKLALKYSKELMLDDQGNVSVGLEEIFFMKDNVVLFVSGFDKAASEAVTFAIKYDKKSGNIDGKIVKVSQVEVDKKRRSGVFGFDLSPNGEFLLIYHYARMKKLEKQQLTLTVFDSELAQVTEIVEDYEFNEKGNPVYSVSNFNVNNVGDIFYLRSKAAKDETGGLYLVSNLFDEEYEKREVIIEITEDKSVGQLLGLTNLCMMVDDNNVYLGGYYVSISGGILKYESINGTFYSKIDKESNEVVVQSIAKFDDELKSQVLKGRQVEKGRDIPSHYYVKDLVLTAEGELIMISEYYTVTVSESKGMRTTTYTYGSIIVTRIDNNGEIVWNKAIPKKQIYSDSQPMIGGSTGFFFVSVAIPTSKDKTIYYSYLLGIGADDIYIIYNDNPKNMILPVEKQKPLINPKKAVPVVVTIDEDGKVTKSSGDAILSPEVILRPKISKQVSENEILVYGSKKKVDKIGRLIFE